MFNIGNQTNDISGIDEAGRGALAGPVVVAAVTWPAHATAGVMDSKKLSAKAREKLFSLITQQAISWSYACIDHDVIDSINIRQATLLGMRRVYELLPHKANDLIIDGLDVPPGMDYATPLVGADRKVQAVSAASIIAKVVRDRLMCAYDIPYPEYGFAIHKGYGTLVHRKALIEKGPSPIHRASFKLRKGSL
jgi:ribonuclease HII